MIFLSLIIAILIYFLVVQVVGKPIENKKLRIAWYCIAIITPVFFITGSILPGYIQLKNNCNAKGGVKVYKTVKVEGYINESVNADCRDCWRPLINGNFKFLEFKVTNARNYKFFKENGIYRVYTMSRKEAGNLCRMVDEDISERSINDKDFFVENCIAVKKVLSPKSTYRLINDSGKEKANGFGNGYLSYFKTVISNRENNEVLSEYNNYTFYPWNNRGPFPELKWSCTDVLKEFKSKDITTITFN